MFRYDYFKGAPGVSPTLFSVVSGKKKNVLAHTHQRGPSAAASIAGHPVPNVAHLRPVTGRVQPALKNAVSERARITTPAAAVLQVHSACAAQDCSEARVRYQTMSSQLLLLLLLS